MNTYSYRSKTDSRIDGYIQCETLAKARYKIWLKGASDYYEDFKSFLKDTEVRKVNIESEVKCKEKKPSSL